MNELIQRLSEGEHPVIADRAESAEGFKESIDRGYVLVKFTETRGGTELGIRLNENGTNLDGADFDQAHGTAHLEGNLTLNYVRVRCIADIDLATLKGSGHLEIIEEQE